MSILVIINWNNKISPLSSTWHVNFMFLLLVIDLIWLPKVSPPNYNFLLWNLALRAFIEWLTCIISLNIHIHIWWKSTEWTFSLAQHINWFVSSTRGKSVPKSSRWCVSPWPAPLPRSPGPAWQSRPPWSSGTHCLLKQTHSLSQLTLGHQVHAGCSYKLTVLVNWPLVIRYTLPAQTNSQS